MTVSYSGIAGRRGKNPTKIVLHNDAGSKNANASFYKKWLENHNPEIGFAHYYVAEDGIYQAELDANSAWHCANTVGNRDYLGIEICQSEGDEKVFLQNEQKAFKLAYELCKKYGIAITVDNFPLHRELSATDCPSRSYTLHGKSNKAVREYFVSQVKKYAGQTSNPTPNPSTPKPSTPKKSIATIAKEVIDGKWGNDPQRTQKLESAGYDANKVQAEVNKQLGSKPSVTKPKPSKKSNDVIAQEVINGQWGNGTDREAKLKKAGYNPTTIQSLVNKKLGAKPVTNKKTNAQIAREIYNGTGGWGNEPQRSQRLKSAGYDPKAVQREVNKLF